MVLNVRERLHDDLLRLSVRGYPVADFFQESGRALGGAIDFDGFCSMTVDPATMLLTSHIAHDSVRPEDVPSLARNEFLEDDVNKFGELAQQPRPAGILSQATSRHPEVSARYRDILQPNAFGDELRLALLDAGSCWGWIALYRRNGRGTFGEGDAELAAEMSSVLAQGVRRAVLLAAVPAEEGPDAPGLVLLAPGGAVEAVTPAGQHWMDELIATPADGDLPGIVLSVAYRALVAARGGPGGGGARARVPTVAGGWLVIHGSVLGDPAEGRTAVVLEPARPPGMAAILLAAYGLTPRERELTGLVLQGLSTDQIAERLSLSGYTVQDHLKGVFAKAGVRSRRELVAHVFFQHYVPRMQSGAPIGTSGWFLDTDASRSPST
ncbi:MAG: hypothetical protein QOC59_971 [Microbacteriaceae bacterium]|nr:hypothetical protein [Microbacteriaceae bacterium]